jgi:hypothetical protein
VCEGGCSCRLVQGEPGRLVGSCLVDPSERIVILPDIVVCSAGDGHAWLTGSPGAPVAADASLMTRHSLSRRCERDWTKRSMSCHVA